MSRTSKLGSIVLMLALGTLPVATSAQQKDAALGPDGTFYQVRAGLYGDLFPGGARADAEAPVLALDVYAANQPAKRVLVEETLDAEKEEPMAVLYEDRSQTLFLLWERVGGPGLYVGSFVDGSWDEVIDVSARTLHRAGSVRLALTHDSFEIDEGFGAARTFERTVLHLVWWEDLEGADGEQVYYAPLVLVDGSYLGWNPVLSLNSMDPNDDSGPGSWLDVSSRAPTLGPGPDNKSVVIGFINPSSGRLLTFEARMLPGEVGWLARDVAAFIMDEGSKSDPLGDIEAFADRVRGYLVDLSVQLHPAVRDYLGEKTRAAAIDLAYESGAPGVVLESFADAIRGYLVDLSGTTFGTDGLHKIFAPARLQILEVDSQSSSGGLEGQGEEAGAAHLIRLHLVSDRLIPGQESGDPVFFVSETGSNSLVCWDEGSEIRYQESQGAGWSSLKTLPLASGLDPEAVEAILRERVRNR